MEKDPLDNDKIHRRFTRRMLQESVSSQAVMNQAKSWNVPNQFKTSLNLSQKSKKKSDYLKVSLSDDTMEKKDLSRCQLYESIIERNGALVNSENKNVVENNILDDQITKECSLNRKWTMELLDNNLIKSKEGQENNGSYGELVSTKKSILYGNVVKAPEMDEDNVTQKRKSNTATFMSTDIRLRKKDPYRNPSQDHCLDKELFMDEETVERPFHRESPNLNVPCKKDSPITKKAKKKFKKIKQLPNDETNKAVQQSNFNDSKEKSHSVSRGKVEDPLLPIKDISRIESSSKNKPLISNSRFRNLRSNLCKGNYTKRCIEANSNTIKEELKEVLERQQTLLQIEIDKRRRAFTNLEAAVKNQMKDVNSIEELFLRDVVSKLNLSQQKERYQQEPVQLNLSQLLSLKFISESKGHSILRCVCEFLRGSPGNVKVDESSKGVILFKFRTRRCLEELMMKHCRGDNKNLDNISELDERLLLCSDSMYDDWAVRVMTQHHSIEQLRHDLKGLKVKSIHAGNNTDAWKVKVAQLVDCFEIMLNDKFKKDVVFILSFHQKLIGQRLTNLTNQGRACLTEQQLLSLVWRGENEESSTNVSDRELYRTCFTRFLSTSQLETVEEDENRELLLVYKNKEILKIDLLYHCRADWRNLIFKKVQRVKMLSRKRLGLVFQSGKELDPTLFCDQIGPWHQMFDHFVVNRRVLLKILRDPQLRNINQNLVVSSNSFFFKDRVKNVVKKELSSYKIDNETYLFNSFQYWHMPISEVILENIGILEFIGASKEVKQYNPDFEQHNPDVKQNISEVVQMNMDDDQQSVEVKEENIDNYNSVVFWKIPLVEIEIPSQLVNYIDNSRVKTTKTLIIDVSSESEASE